MFGIDGAHAAACAINSVATVEATGSCAARELRYEGVVVANGNIKLGADAWMAGHRDGEMPHLPIAGPGIAGKGDDAFFIDRYDRRGDREVLPENLSLSLAFGDPDGAVGGREGATPGSLGRLAAIDVTGIFARGVRKPRPTCSLLHPDNPASKTPGSKTNAIPAAIFVACETASDSILLIVRLRKSVRKPYGAFIAGR
jgi:hypothetical protein